MNKTKFTTFSIRRYLIMGVAVFSLLAAGAAMLFLFVLNGLMYDALLLARIALWLFVAWVLLVLILCLAAFLLVRWITQPVADIHQAAANIATGDYNTRIPLPRGNNEIRGLCEEINHMAEKIAFAERTKLDFISTISHELRTPLTAVKGWSETLLHAEEPDDALLRRGLGVIIDESMRLDNLVEELLDFSRIQAKRLVLNHEPLDILAELDEVVYFFCEQRAAKDGITLTSNTPEVPAPSIGDAARIRQIFINLLDNAFKHTPQGGSITVTAGFTPELPKDRPPTNPPELVHVTIADSGCGVSPEDLPHITEKFYKASTNTPGSGIGLAVVEELLKAHDGELSFESAAGEGLTVYVTFPLKGKEISHV